jgi:hypothetical protein
VRLLVSGEPDQITEIDKFVVTAFFDCPRPGRVTCYAEVCSTAAKPFALELPESSNVTSQPDLYHDRRVCDALLSKYQFLGDGKHIQEIGGTRLSVEPKKCAIRQLSASAHTPQSPSAVSYRFDFEGIPPPDHSWGTWITWEQPTDTVIGRKPVSQLGVEGRFENVHIKVFYFFLVLPTGYRSQDLYYETGRSLSSSDVARDHVFESDLLPDFPIFPAWEPLFRGKRFLRNRRPIELSHGEVLTVRGRVLSDALVARVGTTSYFIGIGFALSAALAAGAGTAFIVEYLHGAPIFDLQVLGALTLITVILSVILGYLGWTRVRIH